jgi:hypothetical protein
MAMLSQTGPCTNINEVRNDTYVRGEITVVLTCELMIGDFPVHCPTHLVTQ